MPALYYPNSTINKQELRDVLPFLRLKTYSVTETNPSRDGGMYQFGIFQVRPEISDTMKKTLYDNSPDQMTRGSRRELEYIMKLQEHLNKLKRHRTSVKRVISDIKEIVSRLDSKGHQRLISTLTRLFGEDERSIDKASDPTEESKMEEDEILEFRRANARQSAYNTISDNVMVGLVEGLGLDARITISESGDVNKHNLRNLINSLLPHSTRNSNVLTLTNSDDSETKYDEDYDALINNISTLISFYEQNQIPMKGSDGNVQLAEKLGLEYFNLDEVRYYEKIPDEVVYKRVGQDLDTAKPIYDDITRLNIMDKVIVRFRRTEHVVEGDPDKKVHIVQYVKTQKTFDEGGHTMPSGMFRRDGANEYYFIGGTTYGTTTLSYERSDKNKIIGPMGKRDYETGKLTDPDPIYGIDSFEFVGELGNVGYLFNIRGIRPLKTVTADAYEGSKYSLPDFANGKVLENAYTGSVKNYLSHSSKVYHRARGKLYCIFYMYGSHPVAADEDNIYSLDINLYRSNDEPRNFRSDVSNKFRLPDSYTLNALNFILEISRVDLSMKFVTTRGGTGVRGGPLHTVSTFVTVAVIRPCDLFYTPGRLYDVKIVKSNISPTLLLREVVNQSMTNITQEDNGMITISDDPLWPRHFALDNSSHYETRGPRKKNVLEVFDKSRMSCIAYCNDNEFNVEILTGESLHVDHIISRLKELSQVGHLKWKGYKTTLDGRAQIDNFKEYVSVNYGKYLFSRMLHPETLPVILNKEFLIKQKRREICYTVFRAIQQNRKRMNKFDDFTTTMAKYAPDNSYIPFQRVATFDQPPIKKPRNYSYPREADSHLTGGRVFNFNLNMLEYTKEYSSARYMYLLDCVPVMETVGGKKIMKMNRTFTIRGDQASKYSGIITQMVMTGSLEDGLSFRDSGKPEEGNRNKINLEMVTVPEYIHECVVFHILLGSYRVDDVERFKEELSKMIKSYKLRRAAQDKKKAEFIEKYGEEQTETYNVADTSSQRKTSHMSIDEVTLVTKRGKIFRESWMSEFANLSLRTDKFLKVDPNFEQNVIVIQDEIDKKEFTIPLKYKIYEAVVQKTIDERDESYQYSFGWIDAPFVDLFLERIDAKSLGFAFYEYNMNKDLDIKNLGTLIHEVCQKPVPPESFNKIITILALKKHGVEVRHEDTILHTNRGISFLPYFDSMENIDFAKPAVDVVDEKEAPAGEVVLTFADDEEE